MGAGAGDPEEKEGGVSGRWWGKKEGWGRGGQHINHSARFLTVPPAQSANQFYQF